MFYSKYATIHDLQTSLTQLLIAFAVLHGSIGSKIESPMAQGIREGAMYEPNNRSFHNMTGVGGSYRPL